MKKVFLLATLALALTGLTMAQTTPKPAPKAKKETTTPAKEPAAKDTTKKAAHHHKKHDKTATKP